MPREAFVLKTQRIMLPKMHRKVSGLSRNRSLGRSDEYVVIVFGFLSFRDDMLKKYIASKAVEVLELK